MGGLTQL